MADKKADLAGPGIGDYDELEKILPRDYSALLTPKETQIAIYAAKNYIEENLCKELNLMMVTVPLNWLIRISFFGLVRLNWIDKDFLFWISEPTEIGFMNYNDRI